jgi:hypothetical protein
MAADRVETGDKRLQSNLKFGQAMEFSRQLESK